MLARELSTLSYPQIGVAMAIIRSSHKQQRGRNR